MKKAYLYARVSGKDQIYGQGLDRQHDLAKQFLLNHPEYELTQIIEDQGISGWSGANIREHSSLGQFLHRVESGKIQKGSMLLLESTDRLSRQGIKKGQRLFDRFFDAGLSIGLIKFGLIIDAESSDDITSSLIVSVSLYLGQLESAQKSARIRSAFDAKRIQARTNNTKFSKICHPWLELVGNEYQVKAEDAKIINGLFEMKLKGVGVSSIVNHYNKSGQLLNNKRLSITSIRGYLQTIAVIGDFQPFTARLNDEGKRIRVKDGNIINNYYPQIITDELFNAVQQTFKPELANVQRSKIKNVFAGIIRCPSCGASMNYFSATVREYLRCANSQKSNGLCEQKSIRYDLFSPQLIAIFNMLNYGELNGSGENDYTKSLSIQTKIDNVTDKIQALVNNLAVIDDSLMNESLSQLKALKSTKLELENDLKSTNYANVKADEIKIVELDLESDISKTAYNAFIKRFISKIVVTKKGKIYNAVISFLHRPKLAIDLPDYEKYGDNEELRITVENLLLDHIGDQKYKSYHRLNVE